jgi:predicted ATPase/class 3 adenylate cyclase
MPTTLPSGTLTFFFSDIEGSTRMLEALGDRYSTLLERHREIVRAGFARDDGLEVNTQGDSFFAVFPEAPKAITAAVAIQRAMGAEHWPGESPLKIRIGLHTGEARVVAGDYVGLDVHRAARIMAAAHGGEIVASESTCQGVNGLDGGIELRDLGEHRLRDLSAAERLYQVIASGLAVDFPPLRTLDRTPNNLPTQPTILIGREFELERIRRHLDSSRTRLVTLTGPGGIGKTRLALQAAANQADRTQDGVYFVDLADVDDADATLRRIADAANIGIPADSELRRSLADQIGQRDLLLVLDNFEQVMSAADDVADLLRACPRLRLIVTSRESLHVRGEQLIDVAPLAFPDPSREQVTAAELARYEAVNLFVERASEAAPDFTLTDDNASTIAAICARLDGLPLAIELAAARLRLFSVEDLRDRLGAGLDVLRGGARDLPARQRTLRDTIAWSHDLLDEDEREIFALLSVFAPVQIDAVERVAADLDWLADVEVVDVLASLVDKSLVRGTANGRGQRLTMLETIREFAGEQLAADPQRADAARNAHATYFSALATDQAKALAGPNRRATLAELEPDLGNFLIAWRLYVDHTDLGRLHALLDVLWPLYESHGRYHGALAILNDLLAVLRTLPPNPQRTAKEITLRIAVARILLATRGYTDEVESLYRSAIALAESEGSIPKQLPVLRSLASFHLYRGDLPKTIAIGQKLLHLAEQQSDPMVEMEGHLIVGPATALTGEWREGLDHLDRALELFEPDRPGARGLRIGPNPGVATAAVSALIYWQCAFPETSDRRAQLAMELATRIDHPYSLAYATFHVGLLDLWSGRVADARARAARVREVADANDYGIWSATGLVLEGVTVGILDDPTTGLATVQRGIALYRERPTPPVFWPLVLSLRATALLLAGRFNDALETADEAIAIGRPRSPDTAANHAIRGEAFLALADRAAAIEAMRTSIDLASALGARAIALGTATRLASISTEGRDQAVAVLRSLLPTLTEGLESPPVVAARRILEPELTAADA